jgi:glucokinase
VDRAARGAAVHAVSVLGFSFSGIVAHLVAAYSEAMPPRRVIGVDMGGTKLLAGAVDGELGVHHRARRHLAGLDQAALLDTVAEAVTEVRENAGTEVAAVGFGIPSLIDRRTEESVLSVHLELDHVFFSAVMAERLDLPVFVDNDSNLAALAEHRVGAAVGASDVVVLTIGTGIGGGLILGGQLYRGWLGAGAELGHMVIDADGPPCQGRCPNRGCVEALASGTALAREALRLARERPGSGLARALAEDRELAGPLVVELAHDGDRAAVEVLALIGERLGVALASYVNIFNPELIVIGGGVIGAGELLLAPAREVVLRRALPPSRDVVRILAASLGVEAGMIGAAALAIDGLSQHGGRL